MLIVLIVNRAPRVVIKSNAVLVADLAEKLNDVVQTVRLCCVVLLLLVFVLHALDLLVFLLVLVVIGLKATDLLAPFLPLLFLFVKTGLLNNCCLVGDTKRLAAFSLLQRLVDLLRKQVWSALVCGLAALRVTISAFLGRLRGLRCLRLLFNLLSLAIEMMLPNFRNCELLRKQ